MGVPLLPLLLRRMIVSRAIRKSNRDNTPQSCHYDRRAALTTEHDNNKDNNDGDDECDRCKATTGRLN